MPILKIRVDNALLQEIERFRLQLGKGIIPVTLAVPYALKLGIYYYLNGGRLPDIRLGGLKEY